MKLFILFFISEIFTCRYYGYFNESDAEVKCSGCQYANLRDVSGCILKACRNDEASQRTMSIWQMELHVCRVLIAVWLAFYHESASEQHTIFGHGLSGIIRAWCIQLQAHPHAYLYTFYCVSFIIIQRNVKHLSSPREKFWTEIDGNLTMQTVESVLYSSLLKYDIKMIFLFILLYKLTIVYYSKRFYTYLYAQRESIFLYQRKNKNLMRQKVAILME